MDNVGFHKNKIIKDLINKKHQHTLLSPYSPFLNPIENVVGEWKNKLNELKHRNDEEVMVAIDKSAEMMQEDLDLYLRCFNHTKKILSKNIKYGSYI
jgi:transposase